MSYNSQKQLAYRQRRKDFLESLKAKGCTDCKLIYPPYVMEFDHARGEKLFNISMSLSKPMSKEKLLAELEKCDVVCCNCHAIRSYKRFNNIPL